MWNALYEQRNAWNASISCKQMYTWREILADGYSCRKHRGYCSERLVERLSAKRSLKYVRKIAIILPVRSDINLNKINVKINIRVLFCTAILRFIVPIIITRMCNESLRYICMDNYFIIFYTVYFSFNMNSEIIFSLMYNIIVAYFLMVSKFILSRYERCNGLF